MFIGVFDFIRFLKFRTIVCVESFEDYVLVSFDELFCKGGGEFWQCWSIVEDVCELSVRAIAERSSDSDESCCDGGEVCWKVSEHAHCGCGERDSGLGECKHFVCGFLPVVVRAGKVVFECEEFVDGCECFVRCHGCAVAEVVVESVDFPVVFLRVRAQPAERVFEESFGCVDDGFIQVFWC